MQTETQRIRGAYNSSECSESCPLHKRTRRPKHYVLSLPAVKQQHHQMDGKPRAKQYKGASHLEISVLLYCHLSHASKLFGFCWHRHSRQRPSTIPSSWRPWYKCALWLHSVYFCSLFLINPCNLVELSGRCRCASLLFEPKPNVATA